MPRSLRTALVFALATAAALAPVACGEEDAKLLPGETAREITANLDTVQQLSAEGDCIGAESAAEQVGDQIDTLEGVDRKLKEALEEGASRLEEVIAECEEPSVEAIAPATTPTEPEEEEKAPKEKGDEEKKEKEEEKPKEEEVAPETTTSPSLPPQANGKGKGLENGNGPPAEEAPAESPSGGVSPGSPAGGDE